MTATLRQVVPAAAEGPGWWSRRPWLGMFLGGLGLWVATVVVTFVTGNLNLVPTIILLGSFLVPVAVVSYGFGHADPVLTAQRIFTAVVSGGVLGIAWGRRSGSGLLPWRAPAMASTPCSVRAVRRC